MVERISALAGQEMPRQFGPDLTLSERRVGSIWQVAAWPDQIAAAGQVVARAIGASEAPAAGQSASGRGGVALRTEPLKWLLVSEAPLAVPDMGGSGTVVDLSHARTVIRIDGAAMPDLMAREMALDFRAAAMPDGRVATSGIHHIAVTTHVRDGGLDLYLFRSFSLTLWEHLVETAGQFSVA
ncbi:MAG: hypothetical protein AAF317_09855 [Pseudomonadota bacterium]